MNPDSIITADFDPFAQRTYTITVTTAQAYAIRDAVACLHYASRGDDVGCYRTYGDDGFMDEAHDVADRLTDLQRPHAARVGAYMRALADQHDRRN